MKRGTTPNFVFTLPFDGDNITKLNIAFAQNGDVIVEKTLQDCSALEKTISVRLTEEETLRFDSDLGPVEMQLRVAVGSVKMASQIMKTTVNRILKDGCL